ncbi:MAG TPA: adenylate/guanylate cyclase domain-containing protein [Candidatus Binatia bacterium]|nr:adenylate/guanylate cyclase domain-containing protein [Candidatus Binatia bacterium]
MPSLRISVVLADDNLIVREGVRMLLSADDGIEVVAVATDYDSLIEVAARTAPQVVVTDIRMPPSFTDEGIRGAREVRKRHPGTGVVVLSQFEEPEYAIDLLREQADGCAYLLKDRVGDGDQLVRAIRTVSTGGSMLDPRIVELMMRPVTDSTGLSEREEALLRQVAEGKPVKAIAAALHTTPAAVDDEIEQLFLSLARGASSGAGGALEKLKMLHRAIVEREEQGDTLSRLLPGGIAEKVRREGRETGRTERMTVTVLMSDIRGYSTIAEEADPTVLAGQLNEHRAAMNRAILGEGGTVMQFVGDAVMAVFGAPIPQADHADRAVSGAVAMHAAQLGLNLEWEARGLPPFHIGIGISTGEVAAALLGSDERLEYTLVGDAVNLAQRIQQWAEGGESVLSGPTVAGLQRPVPGMEALPPRPVKGRHAPVSAYRVPRILTDHRSGAPLHPTGPPREAPSLH